jgi:hypothetical protein
MSEHESNEKMFERMGVDKVRLLVSTSGLPTQTITHGVNWLAQRDKEERSRNEASQSLQMRTALSAKKAAWIAAIAAIIAAILAVISIVVALR